MKISSLNKTYRSHSGNIPVFQDLTLDIPERCISVVLGPSGCGKTTLLKIIAGIEQPDAGTVMEPEKQDAVSFIFQEPRLLPWMDIYSNIDLVLSNELPDRSQRRERVEHVLELVDLLDSAGRFPEELSGGMRQRAAIARAFAFPSELVLMDEPFQSLDLKLRLGLIERYLQVWEGDPRTTVMVTHDIREALMMADVVFLLSERPAGLVRSFSIDIARSVRSLGSGAMSALESAIYETMGL